MFFCCVANLLCRRNFYFMGLTFGWSRVVIGICIIILGIIIQHLGKARKTKRLRQPIIRSTLPSASPDAHKKRAQSGSVRATTLNMTDVNVTRAYSKCFANSIFQDFCIE